MTPPEEAQWRFKWTERDLKEILSLAKSFRSREPLSDRAAWDAGERTYIESGNHQSLRARG